MSDISSLNSIEKTLLTVVGDFVSRFNKEFVSSARFEGVIPNSKPKVLYQASVTTREFGGEIFFDIVNILTIESESSFKSYINEEEFLNRITFLMELLKASSPEVASSGEGNYNYKFKLKSVNLETHKVIPEVNVSVYLDSGSFNKLVVMLKISVPLSSFYVEDIEDSTVLLNTINDVIIEQVPDHMSHLSPNKNILTDDIKQLFKIFRSWIRQGSPLNTKYEELN